MGDFMGKTSFFRELFSKREEPQANLDQAAFLALMSCIPGQSWFSHYDRLGRPFDEFTRCGINLPQGAVTLDLPMHLLPEIERSGASLLPLPFSDTVTTTRQAVQTLLSFATR